jgi:THAP domain
MFEYMYNFTKAPVLQGGVDTSCSNIIFQQFQHQLLEWRANIPKRPGVPFEFKHRICAVHFTPDCFKGPQRFLIQGEWVELPIIKKQLKPDAVPTIFPGFPNHHIKTTQKRKAPKLRLQVIPEHQYLLKKNKVKTQKAPAVTVTNTPDAMDATHYFHSIEKSEVGIILETTSLAKTSVTTDAAHHFHSIKSVEVGISLDRPKPPEPVTFFGKLLKSLETRQFAFPTNNWKEFINRNKTIITICKFDLTADNIPKRNHISIVLNQNGEQYIRACNQNLSLADELSFDLCKVTDCELLRALIVKIERGFKVCQGVETEHNEKQSNSECQLLLSSRDCLRVRCVPCKKEKNRLDAERRYNESRKEQLKKKDELRKEEIRKLKSQVCLIYFMIKLVF